MSLVSINSLATETHLILRNDLRVLWRELLRGKAQLFTSGGFLLAIFVVLQGIALLIFFGLRSDPPLQIESLAWWFFAFVMFGAAMNHAIGVLFERADYDLLLSSPVSSRAILLARMSAITIGSASTVALFAVPLLNAAAIFRSPRYLSGYVTWTMLAATAASAGVWLALLLLRWLGAQRARTWGQVIAGVLGASVYLAFQGQNLLPQDMRAGFAAKISRVFEYPLLTLPARAGRGEVLSLLGLFTVAALVTAITTRLLARLFITGVQEAGGVKSKARRLGRYRFVEGLGHATFWKDLRLIARDPLLLSKVLPTVLYLLPMIFGFRAFGRMGIAGLLAPFGVLIMLMLAPQLTTIATAGEEGWDMIRMSGVSTVRLRIAKIAAAMAVPLVLCVALGLATAVLGRPLLALLSIVMATIAAASVCWLEVATIRPSPRADLIRNSSRGRKIAPERIVISVIQLIATGVAVGLAAAGHWAFASIGCAFVVLVAIACFTFVEARDPEFESAAA